MKLKAVLILLFKNDFMKKIVVCFLLFFSLYCPAHELSVPSLRRLSDYVNPMIGASTSEGAASVYHGLGKTFPGATTPFGLVQVSPNTITGGDNGSGYSDEHRSIEGFAFTQMSGIGWYGDLGNFLVMPTTGKLKTFAGKLTDPAGGYRSRYDKSSEKAQAGYYSVFLTDYGIKSEATAAPHSGMLRFTFPENNQSRIQIDLARRVGGTSTRQYVKVVDDHTIAGWMLCTPDGGGWGNGDGKVRYTVYFYARFSKPLVKYGVWSADIPDGWSRKLGDVESDRYQKRVSEAAILNNVQEYEGKHLGFFTEFETKGDEQVLLKSGISFVSLEGARNNLDAEISGWNFDELVEKSKKLWDKALGSIEIKTWDEEQKVIFYSSLYHTLIDPRNYTDVDGRYVGGDGKVHVGTGFTKRTIFSGWDVFRSQMPLQTIINPAVVSDMLNSLITLADESGKGYFERWELLNAYSGCMVGNPAISMLADAYMKGIRNYDIEKAFRLAKSTSEKFGNSEHGYAPNPYSISKTLEYAYTEWCISRLAEKLNRKEDAAKYKELSGSYKNIFDKEKMSFRPRQEDGSFEPWSAEGRIKESYGCIEANPYQQGWFVPQDIEGMATLMGGKKRMVADLDNFFKNTPETFLWNSYYNHANEPVHHVPFLYNRLGEPWKTQYWSRFICKKAYKNSVEGLVGNEDVGQMSAWYVLASCGIYPVCPGDTRFEITSPVFDEIQIPVGNGKSFSIKALNNSSKNIYIQSARLNGKACNQCFIDYRDIMAGAKLELVMCETPNYQWGINNDF